jgi:hypothetical protein
VNTIRLGCVLASTFVVLAGCGSSDDESAPTTTIGTTSTETSTTETTTTATTPPASGPVTIGIAVREGRPVGGIARPTVEQGDRVQLVVRADVSDHVHLHGYDRMADVAPGRPARLRFRASIPGRFEVELEDRGLQIAELTVRP